jgi:methyltransferase (TIGR00027 family)
MDPATPSRTAMFTAVLRGVHARSPAPILVDPWGERLVPERARATIAQHVGAALGGAADAPAPPPEGVDAALRRHPTYANVIIRSRFAEDCLQQAVARGVAQHVILGAGFDTSWLRPPPHSPALRIFEVDHPATQQLKLQRLAECGVERPAQVRYVGADLAREPLRAALAACDFDPRTPAFFSWLGVTMYLTREANAAALAGIRECASRGSELVFTYLDQALWTNPPSGPFAQMRERVAAAGEPFLCGFDPATLGAELARAGFDLVENPADRELVQRYDPHGVHGFVLSGAGRIARALVR